MVKNNTNHDSKIPYITYYSRSGSIDNDQTTANQDHKNIKFIIFHNKDCEKCKKEENCKHKIKQQISKNNTKIKTDNKIISKKVRNLPRILTLAKCPYSEQKSNRKVSKNLNNSPNITKKENEITLQKRKRKNTFYCTIQDYKKLYNGIKYKVLLISSR